MPPESALSSRTGRSPYRLGVDLLKGLAILVVASLILAGLNVPPSQSDRHILMYWVTLGLLFYSGLPNCILPLIAAIQVYRGTSRKRPGLIAAPFVFVTLWFAVSVSQRVHILTANEGLFTRPVPPQLRDIRTIILDEPPFGDCCGLVTLLSEGRVDQIVVVSNDPRKKQITSHRLGHGDACANQDRTASALLAKAGRTDECIQTETIETIPDGLVFKVKFFSRLQREYEIGCCNEGVISRRSNGVEDVVVTWRYGISEVLSYLPVFGFRPVLPQGIWDLGGLATFQPVAVGGPAFQARDLVAAIYGIDWHAPPTPARLSTSELLSRAELIARRTSAADRRPALDIALSLQDKPDVASRVSALLASIIDVSYYLDDRSKIFRYWQSLNNDRKREFLGRVFDRLTAPDHQRLSRMPYPLSSLRPEFDDMAERAELIFAQQPDLSAWQYAFALHMAQDQLLTINTAPYFEQRRRHFDKLTGSRADGFANRSIAFKEVYFSKTLEDETDMFAARLDDVPDQSLRDYILMTGWNGNPGEGLTRATVEFRSKALARVERVTEVEQRDKIRKDLH